MPKFVEPEKWYITVDCSVCGEPIPFAESPPPEPDKTVTHRSILVRCPHCQKEAVYAPALMSLRQGPEKD